MTVIPAGALIRNREVPELGPGRVIAELDGGSARVVFENSEEVREVALQHADIVRQPLIPGALVKVQKGEQVKEGQIVEADWPDTPRELCVYEVRIDGSVDTVFESQITPISPPSSHPLDQFSALHWRGPFRFFSRWDMHRTISRWFEDSEGLPTTIGARIDPQLHEVHGVRRALWDTAERHLLADEDASARLNQAGVIAQRMYAADPDLRVLVIAPGRRTHRWQSDLELRFGGRPFVRVDASHLEVNPRERWGAVKGNQRLVVSMGCLQQFSEACEALVLDGEWDLVVFDDVHRLAPSDAAYHCLSAASLQAERLLVLGALPSSVQPAELASLLNLLRPGLYDVDGVDQLEARVESLEGIWSALRVTEEAFSSGEELDEARREQLEKSWQEALPDDEWVRAKLEAVSEGDWDALRDLSGYARAFYRLERRIIRCRREQLVDFDVTWNERTYERIDYEPGEAEAAVAAKLDELPDADGGLQMAMRGIYSMAAAGSPDRFFTVLEQRLDALDTSAGSEAPAADVLELLGLDPGPLEEEMLWDLVIDTAPEMDGEGAWIAEALSQTGQWHSESGQGCARYAAAADWIEAHLAEAEEQDDEEEEVEHNVVVVCNDRHSAQDAGFYLQSRLGAEVVETVHCGLAFDDKNDLVERFRRDATCRVLVCDSTGAQGRDLAHASAVVHLEQPFSAARVERRIEWLDRPQRAEDRPVHSVVVAGPSAVEQQLCDMYADALELYSASAHAVEFELAVLDRTVWDSVCRGGVHLEALVGDAEIRCELSEQPRDQAYRLSLDAPSGYLEEDAEFTDLLDFIDGVADSLPVRHWARMLGIQDHSAGPGVYDFKWHWSNVRRGLVGFDVDPDDVDMLMPEEQVGMMSGTFSRKRALNRESLQFFAPGHKLIDGLIEDALGPTDGRATIFARRLGPSNRGKVYLNVVANAQLDPEAWGELDMPVGLVDRAYKHLWPESISVPIRIDLKGQREPSIVEDWDLIQKLEESYQGPEADQKIEYEILVQAIEDAARFRNVLQDAVDLAMEHLRSEREMLVQGAADELQADLEAEIAYFDALEKRGDERQASEAKRELLLRERLVDSLRQETLSLDALAIVVGGTPRILVR